MKLYPEMNQQIVNILRLGDSPHDLYAAARIEQLEAVLRAVIIALQHDDTGPLDIAVDFLGRNIDDPDSISGGKSWRDNIILQSLESVL